MSWRPADREERQLAWLWFAAVLSALVLRPLWLVIAPLLPGCPFNAITGIPCPSCGTTRAALALLHGHPFHALVLNPLATLAGLAFVGGGLLAPVWAVAGGRIPDLPRPLPAWARAATLAALAANWAWVIWQK